MQRISLFFLMLMLVWVGLWHGIFEANANQADGWDLARGQWQQAYEKLCKQGYAVDVKAEFEGVDKDVRTIRRDQGKFSLVLDWASDGQIRSFGTIANGNYFSNVERDNVKENATWLMKDFVQAQGTEYPIRFGNSLGGDSFDIMISGHNLLPYFFDPSCELVSSEVGSDSTIFTVRFNKTEIPNNLVPSENFKLPTLAKITFSENVDFPTELVVEWANLWSATKSENINDLGFAEKFVVFTRPKSSELFQPTCTYVVSNFRRLDSEDRKYFTLEPFGIDEPVMVKKPLPLWIWAMAGGCGLLILSAFLRKRLHRD